MSWYSTHNPNLNLNLNLNCLELDLNDKVQPYK